MSSWTFSDVSHSFVIAALSLWSDYCWHDSMHGCVAKQQRQFSCNVFTSKSPVGVASYIFIKQGGERFLSVSTLSVKSGHVCGLRWYHWLEFGTPPNDHGFLQCKMPE